MESINPATGEIINRYMPHSPSDVDNIINLVDTSYKNWKATTFTTRAGFMKELAGLLRSRSRELGLIISLEMGKVHREAVAEVEKCAWVCDYFAEMAEKFLQREYISTEASQSFVSFQPIGAILAVMPWNFPFWQVFRFAAPTLMAGNTAVLKHASNVPGCALAIEGLFKEAGFPENVFRTLLIGGSQVDRVIRNPVIKAVTLTGSTPAGKAVATSAGSVLKKCVLELGGSDPYIILADAELEEAAEICAKARLMNAGQSCIAAKRFIVVEKVYPEFEQRFVKAMGKAVYGDPFSAETTIGSMARTDLRDELHEQVVRSVELGAQVVIGGEIPGGVGAFYPPTVLRNVKQGMPAWHEELFGPVAALIRVKDEQEALEVANGTNFGLGGAIFTSNREHGRKLAEFDLEAGCCFVNDFVKSDPRLPFGGIKESGFGRELSSFGIREFVNSKTVVVK